MTDQFNAPQNRPEPDQPGGTPPRPRTPKSPPAAVTAPVPVVGTVPPAAAPAPRPAAPMRRPEAPSPGGHRGSDDASGKADQAKGAAQDVAGDAQDAGRAVKDTAAAEASSVKDDAVREAQNLWGEASSTIGSQASDQLNRAAGTVRTFSDDLGAMARGEKPESGLATDLADQVTTRTDAAATWLENHEPADVLDEAQKFARNRPVAFLAIAAGIGFAAGRITRSMAQNRSEDGQSASQEPSKSAGNTRPGAPAPVSGTPGAGAPAYGTATGDTTPGYTGQTDPYGHGDAR